MKISEKQIMRLLQLFALSIDYNLDTYELEESKLLMSEIYNQQSEELKDITDTYMRSEC
jgi:hypothetical protein